MIVANIILMVVIIVGILKIVDLRAQRERAKSLAALWEKDANGWLAQVTKLQRENDDLRNRLREQGKAWSAALKRQQNKPRR